MGPVLFDKSEKKVIDFGDTTEFVIGRSIDHNLCIPDSTISRKQCIIKKVPEGEWLVKDMSSFKTTLVNGLNVPPSGLYIKCGDTITFGTLRSWQLEFYLSAEDMPPTTTKRRRVVDDAAQPSSQESRCSRQTELSECSQPKKPRSKSTENYELKYEAALLEKAHLAESVGELKTRVEELEEAKNKADDILVSSHLDRKQLQTDYEDSCTEVDRLVKERHVLLEELQENIKRREASEANANACGSSSQTSSSEIESSLILKTIEVEELKDELAEAKQRLEKAEETTAHLTSTSEKLYNDAVAIIEQEFLCCVCSDLMYEPVTLNCRHTMCGDCLKEWKKKKKECPSCRTKIKTEVRPIMIDSFIDRIAPLLGDEFVRKRQEAKNDRAAPKTPPPPPPSAYVPPPGPSYSQARGRRGGRRGSTVRGMPPPLAAISLPPLPANLNGAVIDLTNQQPGPVNNRRRNDSEQTDEDEDSSFEGMQEEIAVLFDAVEYMDAFDDEALLEYDSYGDSDDLEEEVDDDVDENDEEDEEDYGEDYGEEDDYEL